MTTVVRRRPSVVVGLDPSYTGFGFVALTGAGDVILQERGSFDAKRSGQGVDRLLDIERWLLQMLMQSGQPAHVCMEGYAFGRSNGLTLSGELGYCVKRVLKHEYAAYPTIVPPTSVKKFVTGRGNAKKDEMLKAVYQRWGFDTNDDNIADAYGLARIAHALACDLHDLPKFQVEVLSGLTEHTEHQHDATTVGRTKATG